MRRNDHEQYVAALYSHLTARLAFSFTGDTSIGSPDISSCSSMANLIEGLPIFGPGIPGGSIVDSFDIPSNTITLTNQATKDGTAATFKAGFLTTSRRIKWWKETEAQPALFLRHTGARDHNNYDALDHTSIKTELFIYSRAGEDLSTAPDIMLNNLVTAIREALTPDNDDRQVFTLGGLVYWCGINGESEYDPGDRDKQSKAVIPIEILLP